MSMEAEITEEVRTALREALGALDSEWQGQLQPLLAHLSDDLLGLMQVRSFLAQHREAAGDRFRPRLESMTAMVEQHVRQVAGDGAALAQVAAQMLELQGQRAVLQQQFELRRDLLEIVVGHGQRRALGAHRVSVGSPGMSLRVVDAEQVPPAFQKPQPDRKAILAHVQSTGELVPGTEVGTRRPAVTVKPAVAGGDDRGA